MYTQDEKDELLVELSKVKVRVPEVLSTGEVPPGAEELVNAMLEAGWSGDPGTGKAVLLPDGSELLDPRPIAPPVDYDKSPDAFTLWQQNIQRMSNIREMGNMVIEESEEDADDFDVPDPEDIIMYSGYELDLVPEVPAVQGSGEVKPVSPEEAKAQYELDRAGVKDGAA